MDGTLCTGTAGFHNISCGSAAFFRSATFEGDVDFIRASVGGNLEFQKATFKGDASFGSIRCGGDGRFDDANFLGEQRVDFSEASFDIDLYCPDATFNGPVTVDFVECTDLVLTRAIFREQASFRSLKCVRSIFLSPATFEGEVNFHHASLGRNLVSQQATYGEKATFDNMSCDAAFFGAATFGGEASFGYASFSQMLSCTEVTFSKEANFRNISCEGTAFFRSATFKGEAHFTFASIGRNLNCTRGTFNDHVNFSGAAVSQALQLVRVSTSRYVDLYQCKMARLELGSTYTFDEGSHVDLRGCYFESFLGEPDVARAFVKSQRPDEFSRDPYLNLERYYRTIGNEFEAKKIHYLGRSELRGCLRSPNRLLK